MDKYEDQRITLSSPFSIHAGEIDMAVHVSKEMADLEQQIIDNAQATVPKGTAFAVPIEVWYEALLLSKSSRASDIHRLSDVPRYGGLIVSQEIP